MNANLQKLFAQNSLFFMSRPVNLSSSPQI